MKDKYKGYVCKCELKKNAWVTPEDREELEKDAGILYMIDDKLAL